MTNPTRAEKREAIVAFYEVLSAAAAAKDLVPSQKSREIFEAILVDYAPLSPERRAELYDRRTFLSYRVNDVEETMDAPLTRPEHKAGLSMELDMLKTWLAEIDAELEGDDG